QFVGAQLAFGALGGLGVLTNLAGGTLSLLGNSVLAPADLFAAHQVVNQGTLVSAGTGTTQTAVPLRDTGPISVQQGTRDVSGDSAVALDGSASLFVAPDGALRLNGSLGGTAAAAQLLPVGAVTIAGGTADDPRVLEVTSADQGAS